jgi:hypothetical protein
MNEIALYVDIEGFSKKFENGGKQAFINLTNDLFKLGQDCYSYLSIIQFGGDGFLIKEIGVYTNDLEKFVELGTILLKAITLRGGMGRVQISYGKMADIGGLYSNQIQQSFTEGKYNILHNHKNIMLINPVIGTAIINCAKLKGPSGPLLLIDKELVLEINQKKYTKLQFDEHEVFDFNWVHHSSENIKQVLKTLGLDECNLFSNFSKYLESNKLTDNWKTQANRLLTTSNVN